MSDATITLSVASRGPAREQVLALIEGNISRPAICHGFQFCCTCLKCQRRAYETQRREALARRDLRYANAMARILADLGEAA